ncbi:MAG: GNAT family N-acetyltransferase [Bdellovibrionales bacterium]|nr:GNAT family N-acetyltransferase [Bdellovibrionales bacterium]
MNHGIGSSQEPNIVPWTIRRARSDDAPIIQELYIELVGDQKINVTGAALASIESDKSNIILVAEIDSQVLGTAFVVLCRDIMYGDQPFAVVENIVVTSSARGQGIGTRLMDKIKFVCKENRCTKIMLLSNAKRAGAHKFFEQNGYRGDLKRGFVNYINRC